MWYYQTFINHLFPHSILSRAPSHAQATGGDQANGLSLMPQCDLALTLSLCVACTSPAIYLELERMGFRVWYDNRADDLTKEGMLKGIEESAAL